MNNGWNSFFYGPLWLYRSPCVCMLCRDGSTTEGEHLSMHNYRSHTDKHRFFLYAQHLIRVRSLQFLQEFASPLQILFILCHMVEVLKMCHNYWVSHLKHFQTTLNWDCDLLSQHLLKWWVFPLVDSLMIMILEKSMHYFVQHVFASIDTLKLLMVINSTYGYCRFMIFNLGIGFEQKWHRF